jgi:hypothetical protein
MSLKAKQALYEHINTYIFCASASVSLIPMSIF